jgi:hypothetical protein
METKWQIGPVKMANGEEAFVDAINEGQDHYRYTGRMPLRGTLIAVGWDTNGRLMYASSDNPGNLAPTPRKTVRVQRWMVVYANGSMCAMELESEAIAEARMYGFALIEIDREVTEGEGL